MEITSHGGFISILDIHFGKKCSIRLDDVDQAIIEKLEQVLKICINDNIQVVLTAGDIFDGVNISRSALFKAWEIFNKFKTSGITVFAIFGNHDEFRGNVNFRHETPLDFLIKTQVVTKYPEELIICTDNKNYSITGFDYYEELKPCNQSDYESVMIAHLFYNNAFMGGSHNLEDEDLKKLGYHNVVLGHDHSKYKNVVTKDGINIYRFGSLARVSTTQSELEREIGVMKFDEIGNRKFIPLKVRDLKDIAKIETTKVEIKVNDYSEIIKEIQNDNSSLDKDIVIDRVNEIKEEKIKKIIFDNL